MRPKPRRPAPIIERVIGSGTVEVVVYICVVSLSGAPPSAISLKIQISWLVLVKVALPDPLLPKAKKYASKSPLGQLPEPAGDCFTVQTFSVAKALIEPFKLKLIPVTGPNTSNCKLTSA